MKQFLKNNLIYFTYLAFAFVLEHTTLLIMSDAFLIKSPWMGLILLTIIFLVYNLIGNIKLKNGILLICFIFQLILSLFSVLLYENTGTIFDFSMLQLASETTDYLDTIDINYWFVAYVILLLIAYVFSTSFLVKHIKKDFRLRSQTLVCSLLLIGLLISQVALSIYNNTISEKRFMNSLYADSNTNHIKFGNSVNIINEISKMVFFSDYNDLSNKQIEEYIYEEESTPTSKFGISKNNNLVTVLVESLEWFGFISDPDVYPNGSNLSEDKLDELFPNLRSFYNSSMVMENHYSQNKTDISEDEALLGMYPSSTYVNYGFPNTVSPSSIASMLKQQDSSISNNYFHSNYADFYNREKVISSLGYDNLYFIEDMVENGVTDYPKSEDKKYIHCMNLDSEMVEKMKDVMFPTNTRFNTHITSISMHGNYVYRPNMQRWLDKMKDLNVTIEDSNLKNYLAAVMEFDSALGLMMEDLRVKGLLDNTTIVLFSDHNTYLSELSYKVKDIKLNDYSTDNYIELYRVPLMIYDDNIGHKVVNKFTTTYDIVPTILDMFGINYYKNLYYGNSIFSDEVSVLYSKAFNIYIADGLMFSNINNILYKDSDVTTAYIKEIENKSTDLLKKIYYINHIFEYNYFKNQSNYNKYISNIKSLN